MNLFEPKRASIHIGWKPFFERGKDKGGRTIPFIFSQGKFYAPPVPPLREGPYPVPKPYAPTIGARDVAGCAPTPPEFWYRQRSLYPQGVADGYFTQQSCDYFTPNRRVFVRCYTALLRACLRNRQRMREIYKKREKIEKTQNARKCKKEHEVIKLHALLYEHYTPCSFLALYLILSKPSPYTPMTALWLTKA